MNYPSNFFKHVAPEPDNKKCWIWSGAKNSSGYGCIGVSGKVLLAHRVAYESHYDDQLGDLLVRHKCDVKLCINPLHLEKGTHKENTQDSIDRGRYAATYDQNKRNARLSREDVAKIRQLHFDGLMQKEIATMFNVDNSTVCTIVNNKAWRY